MRRARGCLLLLSLGRLRSGISRHYRRRSHRSSGDVIEGAKVFSSPGGVYGPTPARHPGWIGRGVTAGEAAAMHAAGMHANPARIWLGLAPDLAQRSAGALRSTFRTLAQGGAVLQDGRFLSERVGRRLFRTTLAEQKRTFTSMPLGELWAIRRSTGVANAIGGVAVPMAERVLLQSGALALLARSEENPQLAGEASGT